MAGPEVVPMVNDRVSEKKASETEMVEAAEGDPEQPGLPAEACDEKSKCRVDQVI